MPQYLPLQRRFLAIVPRPVSARSGGAHCLDFILCLHFRVPKFFFASLFRCRRDSNKEESFGIVGFVLDESWSTWSSASTRPYDGAFSVRSIYMHQMRIWCSGWLDGVFRRKLRVSVVSSLVVVEVKFDCVLNLQFFIMMMTACMKQVELGRSSSRVCQDLYFIATALRVVRVDDDYIQHFTASMFGYCHSGRFRHRISRSTGLSLIALIVNRWVQKRSSFREPPKALPRKPRCTDTVQILSYQEYPG